MRLPRAVCALACVVVAVLVVGAGVSVASAPAKKKPVKTAKGLTAKAGAAKKTATTTTTTPTDPNSLTAMDCTRFLPVGTANSVTGGALALTKVVTSHNSSGIQCEYDNADWPGPQGSAGAISVVVEPVSASTTKYFENAEKTYTSAAARNAAGQMCQPGFQLSTGMPAQQSDYCQMLRPFGASSFELSGYLFAIMKNDLVLVWRGGADYTVDELGALATAVQSRLH